MFPRQLLAVTIKVGGGAVQGETKYHIKMLLKAYALRGIFSFADMHAVKAHFQTLKNCILLTNACKSRG